MRAHRFAAIVLVAGSAIALGGCSDNDPTPAANDTPMSASPTTSPDESESTGADETDSSSSESDPGDFPTVDGYTYSKLPTAAFAGLNGALEATPQVKGVDAKLVKKGDQEVGLVMLIAIDPAAANLPGFEDGFLPGFAGGVAGSDAKPKYEEINGTRVITIGTADGTGTAFAWLTDATATVLVFKDSADAKAFAETALS